MEEIKVEKKINKTLIKKEVDEGYVVKIADAIENKSILSDLQKRLVDKMGYQIKYKKKDKKGVEFEHIIEDLTAKAYFEIGKKEEARRKTRYEFGHPEWTQDDKTVTITISCTDVKSKKVEWGTATEMKYDKWDNLDKFAGQKALTKAQRNALKDLLNYEVVMKCFAAWLQTKQILVAEVVNDKLLIEEEGTVTGEDIIADIEPKKEKTMGDNQKEIIEKSFYAQLSAINKKHKLTIDKDLAKAYFKRQKGVEHFKDLSAEDMKKVCNDLYYIGQDKTKTIELMIAIKEGK